MIVSGYLVSSAIFLADHFDSSVGKLHREISLAGTIGSSAGRPVCIIGLPPKFSRFTVRSTWVTILQFSESSGAEPPPTLRGLPAPAG